MFQKGRSGNPHGRPPALPALRELISPRAGEIVEALFAILHDEAASHKDIIAAASELFNRGFGKSVQPVSHGEPVPDGAEPTVVILPANGYEVDPPETP